MTLAERLQGVLVALAALIGLGVGTWLPIGAAAGHVVVPALLLMLFALFVRMDATHVGEVRKAKSLVGASLALNFVFTPILAWFLGEVLLGSQPDLRIGLLLLLVTPCTDWYLVFTATARGHLGIAAALLPVNLVLQLVLLPVYVLVLGGQAAFVDAETLGESVVLVLVVPLVAAAALRWTSGRRMSAASRDRYVMAPAERIVLPLLLVAVLAMFAWQARTVLDAGAEVLALLPPLLCFFVLLPLIAVRVGKWLRLPAPQRVTLTMTTTARNSPIALALAVTAFPDRPLIAVALVVGPLLELPALAVIAQRVRVRAS